MGCLLKANGLYSRTTVGAVLLAAGAASRLGGRPKALLELGGVPLVMRQLVALSGAGVDEVVVVLGHHADAVEAAIGQFPISIVRNPECVSPRPPGTAAAPRGGSRPPSERPGGGRADDGQASSVRIGLQALSPRLDAVIVALADQPLIDAQDIVALIGAFKKRGAASMVVPRVRIHGDGGGGEALPGNPVIFDAALRDEWLAGEADAACRKWRLAHPERVHWFDTDNRRYRLDIDTPEDLERFTTLTGHTLQWPASLATSTA
ncbi:MAG TPA: nucleotidyltransferase family protein [Burkholderiaceae bacterium]|nr:nucleotidyltransferase family protein [Burkholderiaceae bacterium]